MYRTIYEGTLLKSQASVTATACTWNNIEGVFVPGDHTSTNADDYIFTLNDVEYQCNYFLKGDTKFKASYKTENHDTIMLEYIIATGLSSIKIRTDDAFEVLDSNSCKLVEKLPEAKSSAIVRFSKDKAFLIDFNGEVKEV